MAELIVVLDLNWQDQHVGAFDTSHASFETTTERTRLDAPQGWLVRTVYVGVIDSAENTRRVAFATETFVPDPNDMWYAGR